MYFNRRFLIMIPATSANSINTFIHNNVDPTGDDWFTVGIQPTSGVGIATYYWCDAALTEEQMATIIIRLCQISNVGVPSSWGTMSEPDKQGWISSSGALILQRTNIRFKVSQSAGIWDDAAAALSNANLKLLSSSAI